MAVIYQRAKIRRPEATAAPTDVSSKASEAAALLAAKQQEAAANSEAVAADRS